MKKTIALIGFFTLVGCASTPSDFSQQHHNSAKEIPLVSGAELSGKKYELLSLVKANSCNEKSFVRIVGDISEAEMLLKLEAAVLGADAVLNHKCWTSPIDLVSNCWAAKKCEGTAIKYSTNES